MKKIVLVMFSFLFLISLCACKNKKMINITYDDLVDANSLESVLSRYENISYTLTNYLDNNNSYELWISKDVFVNSKAEDINITVGDNDYVYNKSSKELMKMYNIDDKTYRDIHGGWTIVYRRKGNEKIVYEQENKDTFSFTIELTGETAEKEIAYLTTSKILANECIMYDVVVDKKTLLAKEFTEYIVNKRTNKKTKVSKVSNLKYDTKENKFVSMAFELEKTLASTKPELMRTVTVVKNVNDADEEIITFKVKKGTSNSMLIYNSESVDNKIYYKAYFDRECTKPYYYTKDLYNDMTIYLKKN